MTQSATQSASFASLVERIEQRSTSAFLGTISPANTALRRHLLERVDGRKTDGSPWLADPVIEPMFDWKAAPQTAEELASEGLLHPSFVSALAHEHPKASVLSEYTFPRSRRPYLHQVAAWKSLAAREARSVLVSSGTGSGKTECFLIPILNDLAASLANGESLEGVRALFLYPLNALIESQKDRLAAWTAEFQGRIRYALYNGNLPEALTSAGKKGAAPGEIPDRKSLRANPAPILITNGTMLEYMLIRQDDQPILRQSQGKLKYIVLDEAHTYLGSHAAETALLLRRVMHGFGVQPTQVRFIATSATIGNDSPETQAALRTFLANLSGADPAKIDIVFGARETPSLPPAAGLNARSLPTAEQASTLDDAQLFDLLAASSEARAVRSAILDPAHPVCTLSALETVRNTAAAALAHDGINPRISTLELLDLATRARREELTTRSERKSLPFLRARLHLFHRTQLGIWVCLDDLCPHRAGTALDSSNWRYGAIYFERRAACRCGAKVLEMVLCSECGTEHLFGTEHADGAISLPTVLRRRLEDEFAIDDEPIAPDEEGDPDDSAEGELEHAQDETSSAPAIGSIYLSASMFNAHGHEPPVILTVHPVDAERATTTPRTRELFPARAGHRLRCTSCGANGPASEPPFRPLFAGPKLFLQNALPTLLEHTKAEEDAAGKPYQGRRLITFTDSRQGTARYAMLAEQDAELSFVRSFVHRRLRECRPSGVLPSADQELLLMLETAAAKGTLSPALRPQFEELNAKRDKPTLGQRSFRDLVEDLRFQPAVRDWMSKTSPLAFESEPTNASVTLALGLLLREVIRRTRTANSLESLGFARLVIPALEKAPPGAIWKQHRRTAEEWHDLLHLAVDIVVRQNGAVSVRGSVTGADVDQLLFRWLGFRISQNPLYLGSAPYAGKKNVARFPGTFGKWSPRNRLVLLIQRLLDLTPGDAHDDSVLLECLDEVSAALRGVLDSLGDGLYLLNFYKQVELREVRDAWQCPISRRIVPVTLAGLTPFQPSDPLSSRRTAQPVRMPVLPAQVDSDNLDDILSTDADVGSLVERGLWNDLSRRVVTQFPYYAVAEHSAQLSPERLREGEAAFRSGDVNVLSSSTTMELGVDIGGLQGVSMNNAPPSPANYRQRAGRAGRRGESRAFSFTLCTSGPHGEAVFRTPTWPFLTPTFISSVALDSRRIVQRHVNALAFTHFLGGRGSLSMKVQGFMDGGAGGQSPAEAFVQWCFADAEQDQILAGAVRLLVKGSAAERLNVRQLLEDAGTAMYQLRQEWLAEVTPLRLRLAGLPSSTDKLLRSAIEYQLQRLHDEYLLKELAMRNFLPGHGFPTQVVTLRTTTKAELRRKTSHQANQVDSDHRRGGMPSRDLALALREYAPGASVAIDKRVFEVAGVTLNWHIPEGDRKEPLNLRQLARCVRCGTYWDTTSLLSECLDADCRGSMEKSVPYLEPSGFAVDFHVEPNNDLSRRGSIPAEEPAVTMRGTPWQALVRSELGAYRAGHRGRVIHTSRGASRKGYAMCLSCGRATSELAGADADHGADWLHDHFPLTRVNGEQAKCGSGPNSHRRNLWLGAVRETDVLELQIHRWPREMGLDQRARAAGAIAVALRQALTAHLGIEDREVGWAVARDASSTGSGIAHTVKLYDTATGGAGFVTEGARLLPKLIRAAQRRLQCPRDCDHACQGCLLTYDTSGAVGSLDRHAGLAVLDVDFIHALELPSELMVFGPETQMELISIAQVIERERSSSHAIRLVVSGDGASWDLDEWPFLQALHRWHSQGVRIELWTTSRDLAEADPFLVNRIAALAESNVVSMRLVAEEEIEIGAARLVAEISTAQGLHRYAVTSQGCTQLGAGWGVGAEVGVLLRGPVQAKQKQPGRIIPASELKRQLPGTFIERSVASELDGSLKEFGRRFVSYISSVANTGLDVQVKRGEGLEEIIYTDRYLANPLTMGAVVSVLTEVRSRFGGESSPTIRAITKVSKFGEGASRKPSEWRHDWEASVRRQEIFSQACANSGIVAQWEEVRRDAIDHSRSLVLRWADGAKWIVRLDEGFGFLTTTGYVSFPFGSDVAVQGRAVGAPSADVQIKHRIATVLYVSSVERPLR